MVVVPFEDEEIKNLLNAAESECWLF